MEYISNLRWANLADIKLDLRLLPKPEINIPSEPCVIHFHTEFTDEVFAALNRKYHENPSIQYILISSDGDCGLSYQHEHPPCEDFKKAVYMIDTGSLGYDDLTLAVRCNRDRCNLNDLYSIRMYAFTYCTFANFPPNVYTWFLPNVDIEHTRVTCIPFGIPPWFEEIAQKDFVTRFEKKKVLGKRTHVAFQANTVQRYELINSLQTNDDYLVRHQTVSHEQYVEDLKECGFSLSPHGNGLDCYRNLEAIYLGKVPIMPRSRMNSAYSGLPYINFGRGIDELKDTIELEGSVADMGYWKRRINRERSDIHA